MQSDTGTLGEEDPGGLGSQEEVLRGSNLMLNFRDGRVRPARVETIIIQIIAVIYSAIRAARCGGRGAETDEHCLGGRAGGSAPLPPTCPAFVLFEDECFCHFLQDDSRGLLPYPTPPCCSPPPSLAPRWLISYGLAGFSTLYAEGRPSLPQLRVCT
ncbi:uncharacterized protein [Symphalangus syndactylus]|uniref:uncharacterized protein n=1 Tax=Symphalangus syndactylus TaxID=9590 RepID=UPI0030072754